MIKEVPLFTRAFGFLIAAHFLQALGYASMVLLPLYAAYLGASNAQIGWIMAVASVGGLIFRPFVGYALDTFGRRPTVLFGTVVMVCALGLFAFVTSLGPLIYITRVLVGIGVGALFSGYFTLAADIVPESRRTEGLAIFGVSGLIPLVVNPVVQQLGVRGAELRLVFPTMGIAILCSLFFLRFVPEPQKAPDTERLSLQLVLRSFRDRTVRPVWFATLAFSMLVALFMAFATLTAEQNGIQSPAALWFTYAFGAAVVRIFGGKLPDRIGPSRFVPPAVMSYIIGLIILSVPSTSATHYLVAGLFAGFGHGYTFPILTGQLVTRIPIALRGSALAMFTALWEVTTLIASPTFGWLADETSLSTMFRTAAALACVSLAVWVPLERNAARPSL